MANQKTENVRPHVTWNRIIRFLNLSEIPKVLRDPSFWGGFIVRIATLIGILFFLNIGGDINDMNELLFKGMANLLQGIFPYGQTYNLATFGGPYTQDYFNYPPWAILWHLPALLWLGPQSVGTIDFMPAFFILHVFFDFVIFYRLWQSDYKILSKIIWINPFFVMANIVTFLSLPLMFLTLSLLNLDNGFRSGFYSLMLAGSYQLGAIFIPFILVYQWRHKQLTQTTLGMLPAIIVMLLFLIWSPILMIRDLIVIQIGRPPINWFDTNPTSPYYNRYYPAAFLFYGSIPSIIFNLAIMMGIPPELAPQFAPMMMAVVAILGIVSLIYFIKHPRKALTIFFPGVLLALLIASTAEGLAHYWVLCITLPHLFWRQRQTFISKAPEKLSSKESQTNPIINTSTTNEGEHNAIDER